MQRAQRLQRHLPEVLEDLVGGRVCLFDRPSAMRRCRLDGGSDTVPQVSVAPPRQHLQVSEAIQSRRTERRQRVAGYGAGADAGKRRRDEERRNDGGAVVSQVNVAFRHAPDDALHRLLDGRGRRTVVQPDLGRSLLGRGSALQEFHFPLHESPVLPVRIWDAMGRISALGVMTPKA